MELICVLQIDRDPMYGVFYFIELATECCQGIKSISKYDLI